MSRANEQGGHRADTGERRDEGSMMRTTTINASGAPRPRCARAVLAALATIFIVGACEGDNMFSGESSSGRPRVLDIVMPQSVVAGDTVLIRVDGTAPRGIDQILVSLRGAVSRDTTATIDDEKQQASVVFKFAIPSAIQDSLLIVQAQVSDVAGQFSAPAEVSALAFGPPVVTGVSGPNGVRAGETVNVRVTAFGARRVSRIELSARGAVTIDTAVDLSPSVVNANEVISLRLPDVVQDTLITLTATAHDQFGFSSAPRSGSIAFAIEPPAVQMLVPPSVEAGKLLNFAVYATALRQITQIRIRYSFPGHPDQEDIFSISPTRAQVTQYVSKLLPANLALPEVRVQAFALDRANDLGISQVYTVPTPSGGPVIASSSVQSASVFGGHFVDVRVQATGDRPIKRIRFRWRGFTAEDLEEPETNFLPVVPSTSVIEDVAVAAPCVTADGVFMILITAYDQDDQLSPVRTEFVTVTGNSECDDDTAVVDTTSGSSVRGRLPAGLTRDGRISLGGAVPEIMAGRGQALDFADMVALAATRKASRRGRNRKVRRLA